MAKIKLTKGELKRQRDALKQFRRYLPTLQLKKQQLQIEIIRQSAVLEERAKSAENKQKMAESWAGLFADQGIAVGGLVKLTGIHAAPKNIAGIEVPVFAGAEFAISEYDLFLFPPWVDTAIENLKMLVSLRQEIEVTKKGIALLKQELRMTTQRVNLFEKVKIPEAEEAIRLIKIYIGDQMANAVGRSKIAKRKIEESVYEETLV